MSWLKLQRVDIPAVPVSLDLAKQHLRANDDEDELVMLYLRAAADTIEGPEGAGIALNAQQWDLWLDEFPECEIKIPIGPLSAVDSITYTDSDGVEQTLAAADYEVDTLNGVVRPLEGAHWPGTDLRYNAVKVRFTAGYAEIPSDLQAAVLLLVGNLYAHREPVVTGTIATELPLGVQSIIERYRRGRFA